MSLGAHPAPATSERVFALRDDVTIIGSEPASHIRLAGSPRTRRSSTTTRDEFVSRTGGEKDETRVNGAAGRRPLLRTGTGVTWASGSMSFFREEYADHGRPYGGRVGGELGHQRSQPSGKPSRGRQTGVGR